MCRPLSLYCFPFRVTWLICILDDMSNCGRGEQEDSCGDGGSAKNSNEIRDKNEGQERNRVANKTSTLTELVDSGALVTRQLQHPKLNARWMEDGKMDGKENGRKNKNLRTLKIPKFKNCDFRKMAKTNTKLNKRPVKRLQAGPKQADPNTTQLDKGLALEKLIGRIVDLNMEVSMSKAKTKYLAMENKRLEKEHPALRKNAWACWKL